MQVVSNAYFGEAFCTKNSQQMPASEQGLKPPTCSL